MALVPVQSEAKFARVECEICGSHSRGVRHGFILCFLFKCKDCKLQFLVERKLFRKKYKILYYKDLAFTRVIHAAVSSTICGKSVRLSFARENSKTVSR